MSETPDDQQLHNGNHANNCTLFKMHWRGEVKYLVARGKDEGTHGGCKSNADSADIGLDVSHCVKDSHACALQYKTFLA